MSDLSNISSRINNANWAIINQSVHQNGYGTLPGLLMHQECEHLKSLYDRATGFRKTVNMARYRFGRGEYKYFDYPLPGLIQQIRQELYAKLAPLAASWFRVLGINAVFPDEHQDFLQQCHDQEQALATVLILKYGPGGYNTLHQDLYGEVFFPLQVVLMLDQPGADFTGGEFVLTRQIPRAQSNVKVLGPKKGDALIFTTNFKPEKGARGFYKVNVKHGVSELASGERHTLGIVFHDAMS